MKFERKEYPRPQFRRYNWQSLNGEWEFGFGEKGNYDRKINVPFSYQWEASGIGDKAVHDTVWYKRTFKIDRENKGKRTLLCFNAADYETDLWVNGNHAIKHIGGFTPFKADITQYLKDGENKIYYLTKSIDDTRIISTNDGFETIEESDILGIHDYDIKNAEEFSVKYNGNYDGMYPQGWALFADGHKYKGQPVLLTEFGGIAFVSEQKGEAWGYGNGAKNAEELLERLEQLINGIAQTEFQGYCYTQLTDVQQEVNGLLYADRTPKVDLNNLKNIFGNK